MFLSLDFPSGRTVRFSNRRESRRDVRTGPPTHSTFLSKTPRMTPCGSRLLCVHFCHMGLTLTIRLSKELAAWLETTAAKSGVSQGKLVRDQLEKARASNGAQAFMRLAGTVRGSKDLSTRKGFSRS